MARENIELKMISGWMEKKSRYLKQWRKRWVFFDGVELFTFVKKQNIAGYHNDSKQIYYSQSVQSKATETLKLSEIKKQVLKVNNDRNMFTIIMNDETELVFRCASHQTLTHWVNHIESAMKIVHCNRFLVAKIMSMESFYYYKVREIMDKQDVVLSDIELVIASAMRQNIDLSQWYLPYIIIYDCCRYYGYEKQCSLMELGFEMDAIFEEKKENDLDDDFEYNEEDKYLILINILNSMISVWYCDKTYMPTKMIIILSILYHSGWLNLVLPVDMDMIIFYVRVFIGFLRVTFGDITEM